MVYIFLAFSIVDLLFKQELQVSDFLEKHDPNFWMCVLFLLLVLKQDL